MKNIVEKYLKEDNINEGVNPELKTAVDNFIRFLIGDRKDAINGLNRIKDKDLFGGYLKGIDTETYNRVFQDLYTNIFAAIRKGLIGM